MPLVPALCTQCGSALEIDSSKDAAICPCCNTPFVTEKAINNYKTVYNTTNITNIGQLRADVVNVSDVNSLDNRVKAGDAFVKLGDYESATAIFTQLSKDCPYDYRVWWGLVKVNSKNFTDKEINKFRLGKIQSLYTNACTVADESEKEQLALVYEPYYNEVKDWHDNFVKNANEEIEALEAQIESSRKSTELEIAKIEIKKENIDFWQTFVIGVAVVIGIAVLITATVLLSDGDDLLKSALVFLGSSIVCALVVWGFITVNNNSVKSKLKTADSDIKELKENLDEEILECENKIKFLKDKIIEINTWE